MTARNLLLFLALLSAAVLPRNTAAQNAAPAGQDLSSPEAAIRSFVSALNTLDVNGANCLVGGKIDQDLREWAQDARKSGQPFQVTVLSVQPQVNGDRATAAVSFEAKSGARQQRFDETLSLQKAGADWKIVPPTEEELGSYFKPGEKDPHLLALLTATYVHPKMFLNARDAARRTACMSNLKQLATGALMFLQDHDEKFALRADAWKAALMPYVKSEAIFHCPTDQSGPVPYSFNAQLQGKSMAVVRKPEQTVMIYEGKKGALDFRHDSRATVALANGKVITVTAAEARTLRWTP